MRLIWQYSYISKLTYKPTKLGLTDLVFVCSHYQGVSYDYKSVRVAVKICASPINSDTKHTQTNRQTDRRT